MTDSDRPVIWEMMDGTRWSLGTKRINVRIQHGTFSSIRSSEDVRVGDMIQHEHPWGDRDSWAVVEAIRLDRKKEGNDDQPT